MCGGSWNDNANNCRSDNPNMNNPDNRNNIIGFRVVLVAPELKYRWISYLNRAYHLTHIGQNS